jgi:hypothetical protein
MAHDDGQDGKVMRHALGSCASTADFEAYLDSLKAAGVINSNSNSASSTPRRLRLL